MECASRFQTSIPASAWGEGWGRVGMRVSRQPAYQPFPGRTLLTANNCQTRFGLAE